MVTVMTLNYTDVLEEDFRTTTKFGVASRTGVRTVVEEVYEQQSLGDKVVSRDLIPFMRSRNVQFVSKKVKPLTQLYAFFDGVNVTRYCVPKLLEIGMTSGTFQVGETVVGRVIETGLDKTSRDFTAGITFRVAQSNHKEGPYNVPTTTFSQNPYTNQPLASDYSSTSNLLNVDTFSLSNEPQGEY